MCLCYKKHETFCQLISAVLPIHYEIKQLCHQNNTSVLASGYFPATCAKTEMLLLRSVAENLHGVDKEANVLEKH